jgi:hypothetical protein
MMEETNRRGVILGKVKNFLVVGKYNPFSLVSLSDSLCR